MERNTTESELLAMANNIATYKRSEWYGNTTKRGLQEDFNHCKEVSQTLSRKEMLLLWYLRGLEIGTLSIYCDVAKKQYDGLQAFQALKKC